MRCTKSTDFQELFGPRSSGDNLGENSVVELATTTATAATTTTTMPPIVHSHSSTLQYGKSSFFVGKSSIHGHVQ